MTTRGWRPSASSAVARVVEVRVGVVALAHLLDRELEDLGREAARPSVAARVAMRSSSSRQAASAASATSSCAGDGSAVAIRCCSSWPGRASARASGWLGVPRHPARRPRPRRRPRRASRGRAPGRAGARARARRATLPAAVGGEQRPDQVRAAALVLLRARLAVLVGPDRDVLGAVVGGELAAAQREQRRRERRARPRAARARPRAEPVERAHDLDGRPRWRASPRARRALERQPRLGQPPPELAGGTRTPRRAAAGRAGTAAGTPRREQALARATATLSSPSSVRTAHAHAVGPWTSTPFGSAIPPSRILSLMLRRA